VNLGLEPRTLQFLICEAHQRLKASQPLTAPDAGPAIENRQSSIENGVAAKAEPGGDMTELSDNSDRVPSPADTRQSSLGGGS
jgi:hypothetical protein